MQTREFENKIVVLSQAQFLARQTAGTLEEGVTYEINDFEGVGDVKVDGVSVVSGGVANIAKEVFVAVAGTTTRDEILAAFNANKFVVAVSSDRSKTYTLAKVTNVGTDYAEFYFQGDIESNNDNAGSKAEIEKQRIIWRTQSPTGDVGSICYFYAECANSAQKSTYLGRIYKDNNRMTIGDGTTANKIAYMADVVNNTTSTDTDKPLSANMGKELQDQVNNLKNIGRFLSIWNATTGLPLTNPTTLPYTYKTGDYYRVGAVGTTNYKPDGATYTGSASTVVETDTVTVGSVYYYDGTQWKMQSAGGGGTVQDVQVDGTSVVASGTGIASVVSDNVVLKGLTNRTTAFTNEQKISARNAIGAIALMEYDSTATPVDGVLYYEVE